VHSFEDGLRIVKTRGEAMQAASDASPSGMASIIGLDSEKVAKLCEAASEAVGEGEGVRIANYLCPVRDSLFLAGVLDRFAVTSSYLLIVCAWYSPTTRLLLAFHHAMHWLAFGKASYAKQRRGRVKCQLSVHCNSDFEVISSSMIGVQSTKK
jgi:hypothetical protein